ncbi:MAG: VCBS repeat-containing protein [Bacteroidota bacterium]
MIKSTIKILTLFLLVLCLGCDSSSTNTASTASSKTPLFELVPSQTSGVTFNNRIQENFKNFFARFNYVYNGGGVAIGDINNDGLADIYFTGNEVANQLYLNKGNFQFDNITLTAGVDEKTGWHNGVVMADVNADGWLDIYVCRGGWEDTDAERSNLLFINNGKNSGASGQVTFTESASQFGLDDIGYSLQASFFDMDNDGDLDMYLTNRPDRFFLGYDKVLAGKKSPNDLTRDKLYRNDNGKFTEIGLRAGIVGNYGYGLGLTTADVNKDGFIDIYVANDYLESDYLYINQGDGTFREQIKKYTRHVPFYAMGVDAVDINNDGWEDLIELEMLPADYVRSKTTMAAMNTTLFENLTSNGFQHQYMHNMVQLNRGKINAEGDAFFSEVAQLSGVAKTDWSWACLGSDFDNDGWRDIFITNGFRRDIWDKDANAKFQAFMKSPQMKQQTNEENARYITNLFQPNQINNYIFKNNGDLTFSDQSENWGMLQASFSNGAAVGDLDNDGDLDLVVNNIEGEAFLYKNRAEHTGNNFIKIKLEGEKNNPFGLGAKVTIRSGEDKQYHEFKNVRGYLSSVEPILHFGIGKNTTIDEIQVEWLNGLVSRLENIKANELITIKIQNAQPKENLAKVSPTPLLFNISNRAFAAPIRHRENAYDDYKDQILLPHKLSQTGPCLAVGDVNGDGKEDFFVGGANGQRGQLFLQKANQNFVPLTNEVFEKDKNYEDVGATFFDADGDGDLDLYVVSGGNEMRNPRYYQDRLYLNENGEFVASKNLPITLSSGSCVKAFDWDDDGDQDLFVGGRVSVGKYPHAPRSYLLENVNGKFRDATEKLAPEIAKIGMVTDATWMDVAGDATPELIVVGEWMPISIFQKTKKGFQSITSNFGLEKTTGWWNSISATDIDNDGDMDFVVGNLGLNYKFHASEKKPFVVFAKDFDRNGTNDVFLAKYNEDELVPIRGKECSSQQLPILNQKFKTYQQFAESNIHEILDNQTQNALKYEAQMFESVWLENKNGQLIVHPLPKLAQLSAINGIVPRDLNQDGKMDLILAGNKYESEIETTRADASIGLVMLQIGSQRWQPLPSDASGFFVPQNVKAMETIQIGVEKAVLVGVNNGEIQLWKSSKNGQVK